MRGNRPRGITTTLAGALLALIREAPGHGYGLAARFRHRVGPAFAIEPQAVYPHLAALHEAGVVDRQVVHRRGGRPVYIYMPNRYSAEAVREWLSAPLSREAPFREVVIKITFSEPEDLPLLEALLERFERECRTMLRAGVESRVNETNWGAAMTNINRFAVVNDSEAKLSWVDLARNQLREAYRRFTGR